MSVYLTGVERTFDADEIIVSKTDVKGRISYANEVFIRVGGYEEHELLGQPHSLVRHPDMPRAIFRLLWAAISKGDEIFAYVVNRAKNGDHYWVLAHVTPTFDAAGAVVGYHSNRRVPRRKAVAEIAALYADVVAVERSRADRRDGVEAGLRALLSRIEKTGVPYDEFVLNL